jgi:hypothetical protein
MSPLFGVGIAVWKRSAIPPSVVLTVQAELVFVSHTGSAPASAPFIVLNAKGDVYGRDNWI